MRNKFFRDFIFVVPVSIALAAFAAYAVMTTGEPIHHHHLSAHEACPNGVIGGEQTRVEGGTDGDVDAYHFYTCADGREVSAND